MGVNASIEGSNPSFSARADGTGRRTHEPRAATSGLAVFFNVLPDAFRALDRSPEVGAATL